MSAPSRVKCRKMTSAAYAALSYKRADTLYFVNGTGTFDPESLETDGMIYLGDKLLSAQPDQAATVRFVRATGTSSALTAANVNGITRYQDGLKIVLYNGTGNSTTTTPTLNINGLGARPIYRYGSTAISAIPYQSVTLLTYVEDPAYSAEGAWLMDNYVNSTYQLQNNYDSICGFTTGPYGVHANTLCAFTSTGLMTSFTTSGGTTTGKQLVDYSFPMDQPIYLRTSAISASLHTGTNYNLYYSYQYIDIRNSMCNYATSRMSNAVMNSFYMKVELDEASGTYRPVLNTNVNDHIVVQTELEACCFYIDLGRSYNTTRYNVALRPYHPLYYYDGTALIEYHRWKMKTSEAAIGALQTALGDALKGYTDTVTNLGDDATPCSACSYVFQLGTVNVGDEIYLQATIENRSDKEIGVEALLLISEKLEPDGFNDIQCLAATQIHLPTPEAVPVMQQVSLHSALPPGVYDESYKLRVVFTGLGSSGFVLRRHTTISNKDGASQVTIRRWATATVA